MKTTAITIAEHACMCLEAITIADCLKKRLSSLFAYERLSSHFATNISIPAKTKRKDKDSVISDLVQAIVIAINDPSKPKRWSSLACTKRLKSPKNLPAKHSNSQRGKRLCHGHLLSDHHRSSALRSPSHHGLAITIAFCYSDYHRSWTPAQRSPSLFSQIAIIYKGVQH